ncbi:MAG: hypothetical protein QM500_17475 [Methylococcales bacterium]
MDNQLLQNAHVVFNENFMELPTFPYQQVHRSFFGALKAGNSINVCLAKARSILKRNGFLEFDSDNVIFWYSGNAPSKRGQGKRVKGMIKGGMSARVNFESRIETTISKMKEHASNITQEFIKINYHNIILNISREELNDFLQSPRAFTLTNVTNRLDSSSGQVCESL